MLRLSPNTLLSHLSRLSPGTLWVLWPHDFTLLSHFSLLVSSILWVLWPHDFTLLSHFSLLVCSILWVLWPHDFTLVSHLSWFCTCLPLVSLGSSGPRESSSADVSSAYSGCTWPDVFPPVSTGPTFSAYSGYTWPDVFTLVSTCCFACLLSCMLSAGCFYTGLPACLPSCCTCLDLPQTTLDTLGRSCLLLVSNLYRYSWSEALSRMHLSPLVPLLVSMLGYSRPGDFTLVHHLSPWWSFCFCLPSCYTCLHLFYLLVYLVSSLVSFLACLLVSPWVESF